ncbi:sensor histidine kinase [Aurantibacillus circumpalustris]|uniref:sensor histidine kinase n=1 Tax=Aurantibacillus circumpalustris TaxID=3036359 RepID=UPI00295A5BAC|nr:ATP-binding protein [Aurantibacillus circumpalustris]
MEKSDSIVIIVLVGAIIMFGIAILVIYFVTSHRKKYLIQQNTLQRIENEKEQAILKAIISGQEEERNRIAKNLHDSVGAELSMLKLNFSKYLFFMKGTDEEKNNFRIELNNLDHTIATISAICKDLYPIALTNQGIIRTLKDLIKRINDSSIIKTTFKSDIEDSDIGTNQEKILNVFRIFQEVLNNLIKHSNCSTLNVILTKTFNSLEIKFEHNGQAFTNEHVEVLIKQNKGIGLSSIQNRIELLKGTLNYTSTNNLTQVLIRLPHSHGKQN